MTIEKALEQLKYDVRLIDYHLNNGVYTRAELQKFFASLPDLSGNVMLETEEEDDDIEIDDEIDTDESAN